MKSIIAGIAGLTLLCSAKSYATDDNCDYGSVNEDTFDLVAIELGAKAEQEHLGDFTSPTPKKGKKIPWTLDDKHEIAEFVEDIMRKSDEARHDQGQTKLSVESKLLANERVAWWEDNTGTFVIFNPNGDECGTAFRPDQGKKYYEDET